MSEPADLPESKDLPVGLDARGMRREFDSLGEVEVPAHRYWGAQTQRCMDNFAISREQMPVEVIRAYGAVKKAAAIVNASDGRMPADISRLIESASDEVMAGDLDSEFPLLIWQSGSGTQTNMNVNEVIANRCIQQVGGVLGSQQPVAPNHHVNMSQSTNDTFVAAMHIAAYRTTAHETIPALERLRDAIADKASQWAGVVKIGRTHLQDATPLTVGQEWSGYAAALDDAVADIRHSSKGLLHLAVGGTAVGTGVNAPQGFGAAVAQEIAVITGDPFIVASNPFAAQATLDQLVRAHASLKAASSTLYKIANDMRWLGSGPHAGLTEIQFPANEPGSSIMPGKVNPTQAEALLMICLQVMGADVTVSMAGAEGNFELNAFRPVVIDAYLRSARTIAGGCDRFRERMILGAELDTETLDRNVERSVMLVTALAPTIGYHQASAIAQYARAHDATLREAALANGVSAELFDELVDPVAMTKPDQRKDEQG